MDRRAFLATAAATIVSPLAAAVVTTNTVVTNSAWTDLGPGPMLLSFKGDGVYAIGDTAPSLTDGGFTIRRGDSLSLKTTSHVWARATSSSGVSVYASSINGGGGATSVWSAADAAANGMTLSNGGLTVTAGTNVWGAVRGTVSRSSGKLYFEVSNSVTAAGNNVGIALGNAGFNIANYPGATASSMGAFFNTYILGNGFTINIPALPSTPPVAGDVLAMAVDFGTGNVWLAYNNIWQSSGNPATGANPAATFVLGSTGPLFPTFAFETVNTGVWTLQSTAASQTYAPPAGFSAWDSAAPTHSPQALAYLARTVGGNEGGNGTNIATLIDGLVSDGVWAKLDALYVLAQQNATDAVLNLVGTSYTATNVASSPFTTYKGFGPFSAGMYLDTGFNDTTAPSPNYTLNSASLGVWSYAVASDGSMQIGTDDNNDNLLTNYGGSSYARINGTNSNGVTPATNGLFVGDRSSSASVVPYWNGVSQGTQTSASSSAFNATFTIGSQHGTSATTQTLCAAFIGASLGSAGQLALYTRLRTYMTAIGVP